MVEPSVVLIPPVGECASSKLSCHLVVLATNIIPWPDNLGAYRDYASYKPQTRM